MALIEHRSARREFSVRAILAAVQRRLDLWRTRRALARLDAHLLEDIGVSPLEARHEADLTVWDVPETWRNR